MRVKTQLFLMALVPCLGIAGLVGFGNFELKLMTDEIHKLADEDYGVIVNDDLHACVDRVEAVYRAARSAGPANLALLDALSTEMAGC